MGTSQVLALLVLAASPAGSQSAAPAGGHVSPANPGGTITIQYCMS